MIKLQGIKLNKNVSEEDVSEEPEFLLEQKRISRQTYLLRIETFKNIMI